MADYNLFMARGWESKAIEEQQSQATSSGSRSRPRATPEQMARQRQRQGLLLSRSRVIQQLGAAQNTYHRQMLEDALRDLDSRLAQLG